MARKSTMEELIHCNVCGEDYSPTYRRCPFCGERVDVRPMEEDDFDDGYVFDGQALFDDQPAPGSASSKGGKRLAAAAPRSGGSKSGSAPIKKGRSPRYDPPGSVNWVRLITYGISLVIIIAALIIVFTVIYPRIHTPDDPDTSTPPGTSTVEPTGDPTGGPTQSHDVTTTPEPTATPEPTTDPGQLGPGTKGIITGATGGLNVRSGPGTTYSIQASLVNGNEVTVVEDAGDGWYQISYSGPNGQATTGYIKGDYITASGNVPSNDPPPSTDPVPSASSGQLTPGAKGRITGAASGLRVRSGPGTTYDILASLVNGNEITVLEDAGSGWYKIAYSGADGQATTGYIMGSYIAVD